MKCQFWLYYCSIFTQKSIVLWSYLEYFWLYQTLFFSRQCIPVCPGTSRAGVVDSCLTRSYLWQYVEVMELTENMRVMASGDQKLIDFDQWCLDLGNGDLPVVSGTDSIEIPESMVFKLGTEAQEATDLQNFVKEIFPNIDANYKTPGWFQQRAILAPTIRAVDWINEVILKSIPEDEVCLTSSDMVENQDDLYRFNIEYLNSLHPTGLPKHQLVLKPGVVIMLLRNLDPRRGLSNGTRMTYVKHLNNKVLQCLIQTATETRTVFIPRITLRPRPNQYPFLWSRRQFPVRVSASFTINKSQVRKILQVCLIVNM